VLITILYPYRSRDLERVKRSLDSLALQTDQRFKVLFVDYGSSPKQASQVEQLIISYSFANYIYTYTTFQPWSRAKALNVGLQQVTTDFVFTADIDMIFSPHLVSTLYEIKHIQKAIYFKVGFLSREESFLEKSFHEYTLSFTSGVGAQGLSFF
jgi:cellulose synthase/poly-beta-1,6-N-acetylglucosamine synthase-like glycosyltransferase